MDITGAGQRTAPRQAHSTPRHRRGTRRLLSTVVLAVVVALVAGTAPAGAAVDNGLASRASGGGAVATTALERAVGGDAEAAPGGDLSAQAATPRLVWRPCGAGAEGVLCATARVPQDYANPTGPSFWVKLAKVPASNPARKIGTVFVNPGGPGGSGVLLVRDGFGQFLEQRLRGRFDIVGFDPRGVAFSSPLQYYRTTKERDSVLAGLPVFPWQPGQAAPFFQTWQGFARACQQRDPRILARMSTADVARDLDLLRRAVGDRQLSYLGFSYGSHLGQTYANLFPRRIRAMVIDGVLDPIAWTAGTHARRYDARSTQATFDEFLRLCTVAGSACALNARGNPREVMDRLARRLQQEPLVLDFGDEQLIYTYDLLIGEFTGAMYATVIWPAAAEWAAFLDEAASADASAAASPRAARVRQRFEDALDAVRLPSVPAYDNGREAYFGNRCADGELPASLPAWRAGAAAAGRVSPFGPLWWWFDAPCATLRANDARWTGPWTARTSNPVLIVGNRFDPATAYEAALKASRLLPNSRLLTYAGWGHTAYGTTPCTTQTVERYLVWGGLPPRGKVCRAQPNPFTEVGSAQRGPGVTRPLAFPPAISELQVGGG
jgi:pimeloyl-ACP methyl ester carboxylesterase